MRLIAAVALVLAGTLTAPIAPAQEQVMNAGDLQELCAGTDHVSVNVCRVYILGVAQGITLGMHLAASHSAARPCVPPGTSGDILQQRVKQKLATLAPGERAHDAAAVIAAVLGAEFSCTAMPH